MMDIGKAFTFVTEDERWVSKIGIGALISFLSFLIIPIPLLWGYLVGVARNVKDGVPDPMPEWDDWGKLFMDGLSIIGAQLVYTLPFWFLTCIAGVGAVGFGSLTETSEDLATAGLLSTFGFAICLTLLWAIALLFISPAIVIQYVKTGDFGSLFHFGEIFSIAKRNIVNILLITITLIAASLVVGIVFSIIGIIPCIGQIIGFILGLAVGPYFLVVTGHLYGQIAE
jgi:hypothetical protein